MYRVATMTKRDDGWEVTYKAGSNITSVCKYVGDFPSWEMKKRAQECCDRMNEDFGLEKRKTKGPSRAYRARMRMKGSGPIDPTPEVLEACERRREELKNVPS